MSEKNIKGRDLLNKYAKGDTDKEEKLLIENWYNQLNTGAPAPDHTIIQEDQQYSLLEFRKSHSTARRNQLIRQWGSIAAVLIMCASIAFLLHRFNEPAVVNIADIKPGGSGATLVIGGKRISLNDKGSGAIIAEGGVKISKIDSNLVAYEQLAGSGNVENTLITEKGQTFSIRLSDGTLVYLNASSSIKYNSHLVDEGVRKVVLSGEAYFEVAKDKSHPFIVESKGQQIEVLGTHFNVKAYDTEEATKTTLLEGSVKVSNSTAQVQLSPGEQARLSMRGGTLSKERVNAEDEIAWKNGILSFNGEDIYVIIRQLERWYNVNIAIDPHMPHEKFYGQLSRQSPLTEVLKILAINDVEISQDGQGIRISRKNK